MVVNAVISNLLVGDKLDAQFFYKIPLFHSSTCLEQTRAHHQEVNYINTASVIVTLQVAVRYAGRAVYSKSGFSCHSGLYISKLAEALS